MMIRRAYFSTSRMASKSAPAAPDATSVSTSNRSSVRAKAFFHEIDLLRCKTRLPARQEHRRGALPSDHTHANQPGKKSAR